MSNWTHSFLLLLVAASLVHLGASQHNIAFDGLSEIEKSVIVDAHNIYRSSVRATNMIQVEWSEELAKIAQEFAEKCTPYTSNLDRNYLSTSFAKVGENVFFSFEEDLDYLDVMEIWYNEGKNFDLNSNTCTKKTCGNYTQMFWGKTRFVGCGVSDCDGESFKFVCNYGPSGNVPNQVPYKEGKRCTECPADFKCSPQDLCTDSAGSGNYLVADQPQQAEPEGGDEEIVHKLHVIKKKITGGYGGYMGHDPHFSVKLSDGNILCYNVQGEKNSYFKLLGNDMLEVNAKFIPDQKNEINTWIGEIGISVINAVINNTTRIKFDIKNFQVLFNGDFSLDAHQIERLIITKGKLLISSQIGTPRIGVNTAAIKVEFRDLGVNFTIRFIKQHHLDMYWQSRGLSTSRMDGIIGQFLHKSVKIDPVKELLYLPSAKQPVPVVSTLMWKFMESHETFNDKDHTCWSTVKPSSQGKGLLQGSYLDYKVADIFSAEFNPQLNIGGNL